MENQDTRDKPFQKFRWTIRNFSKLDCKQLYSGIFSTDDHKWRILIYPKGNKVDFLSIYLDAVAYNLPSIWTKFANFKFALINHVNNKMTKIEETSHQFNTTESDWGYKTFIPLNELCDPSKGFIVNDTCIIEIEILVSKSEHMNLNHVDQPLIKIDDKIDDKPIELVDELVDFKGLGKIEKAFVPLLEEVCSQHSSLIDSQRKGTSMFIEYAFRALGRVLHFLKNKKVKDMDDDACNHLQILWDELEPFRFDLTWLEPHVQSAFHMKNYMEKTLELKKMKENVAALEMEKESLKAKMTEIEVELKIARRDLVKAEEGFEERNLDAELGYGAPLKNSVSV